MPIQLSAATSALTCAVLVSTLALAPAAQAATVASNVSSPVLIGAVVAGQTYSVVVSGESNLLQGFNGGLGLTFTADGKPTYAFPAPYAAFFPNGLDYDSSVGPSNVGVGGAGRLMGSLLGTFTANPSGPGSYFAIGLGTTFTAAVSGALYGQVNDTFYGDNTATGFSVTLTPVPEPAGSVLMLTGVGALLFSRGRSTKTQA